MIRFFFVVALGAAPLFISASAAAASATAEKLVNVAGKISEHFESEGNLKNQLLVRFAVSANYYLKNYPDRPDAIYGLHVAHQAILNDPKVSFYFGVEDDFAKKLSIPYRQLAKQLQTETKEKLPENFLVFGNVTYLRFMANKTALVLQQLAPNTSASAKYVSLRNQFVPIQNQITALSTVKDMQKLKERVAKLLISKNWQSYAKLARSTYVKIQSSDDISGLSSEFEKAEAITVGNYIIESLLKGLVNTRAIASASVAFDLKFPPEEVVALSKTPQAKKSKSKRRVASIDGLTTLLIGNIPGHYLNKDKNQFYFGIVEIRNRLITAIREISVRDIVALKKRNSSNRVVELKNETVRAAVKCTNCVAGYDAIYPGMINLHNHTKQNNLSVWGLAQGQFHNRFEWRDWDFYTKSVSQNMNPWIQFGKPIECAAFRWSEMQAMVTGTTYLQGPSSCVTGWGIQRVEDGGSYVSSKLPVQAPTDIVVPNDMVFVWKTLKPIIDTGKSYEQALTQVIHEFCPALAPLLNENNINEAAGLQILTDQKRLESSCGLDPMKPLPAKFVRYIYWVHDGIAGRKKYLNDKKSSAVIAHLSEGSRTDSYNQKEYEILKLLGLNLPRINFVHGVGIPTKFFAELAKNEMGLIWSPFSNFLLYGETLDIKAAHEAGITLALGSDWLPTGSRGVLEEVKVAASYIDRTPELKDVFSDEYLFKMITENPAKLINHHQTTKTEAAVGKLEVGAMGSVVVVSVLDANPYTNLVRKVTEKDVNLVVIDGKSVYGNTAYLNQTQEKFEIISELDTTIQDDEKISFTETADFSTAAAADIPAQRLQNIAEFANGLDIIPASTCSFTATKGFVRQSTLSFEPDLEKFKIDTELNLDRFADIQKILAVNLLNLSANKTIKASDRKYAASYFPPLYSCNDVKHVDRVKNYIKADGNDELAANLKARVEIRKALSGKGPAALAEQYK